LAPIYLLPLTPAAARAAQSWRCSNAPARHSAPPLAHPLAGGAASVSVAALFVVCS